MEITFLGYVSIILTVIFMLQVKPERFLYAAVFFMGFSGSSVINISDLSIQPSYYFFLIYFVYYAINCILKHTANIAIPKMLIVFFLYCCITVVFSVLLENQDIVLMNVDGKYVNLTFTSSNITQLLYLALCMLFVNTLYDIKNDKIKNGLYKAFKYGFIAVILICLYQLIAFEFDLEFDYFFRQSVHGNVQGTRLYGPCGEASMLCYYILPSCVLIFINCKGVKDLIWVILGLVIGVLTYSSTFLIGCMIIAVCLIVWLFLKARIKFSIKFGFFVTLLVACIVFAIVEFDYVSSLFTSLINKLSGETTSGEERMETFITMSLIGLKYPFGVGFGSSRSKDLFSTWMCNIGVAGIAIFIIFIISYIAECDRKRTLSKASPFLLVVVLMFISVAEPYNLFIWFFMWYGSKGCLHNDIKTKLKTVKQ